MEVICGAYGFWVVFRQVVLWLTGWTTGTGFDGLLELAGRPGRVFGVVGPAFTSTGPVALTAMARLLSTITGAWEPSVNTTTASRLPGLLNTTRGPSTRTWAPEKTARSEGLAAG